MLSLFRKLLVLYAGAILICSLAYPGLVTAFARSFYTHEAEGSIIGQEQLPLASSLIGQAVVQPIYFFGRPSATKPFPTNAAASAASQDAVASEAYKKKIAERVAAFLALEETATTQNFAPDLVMASGSGVDPAISLPAATQQISRIARLREKPEAEIKALVDRYTSQRQFGFLGEPCVNVNLLNLALDGRI